MVVIERTMYHRRNFGMSRIGVEDRSWFIPNRQSRGSRLCSNTLPLQDATGHLPRIRLA